MMIKYQKLFIGAFLWLIFSTHTLAAPDIAAGKEKSGMCLNCHGAGGNSQSPGFPSLAGQKPAYIANQLRAFRTGTRENAMMQNMAANLSDQDINNLAAYFTTLQNENAGGDSALAKKAESKASMCLGCHGQGAKGVGATPRLAGQQPVYLQRQLQAFKEGTRKGGPMRGVANMLSDDEMAAIAAYMGNLK